MEMRNINSMTWKEILCLKIHHHPFVSSIVDSVDMYFISDFYFDVNFLLEAGDL